MPGVLIDLTGRRFGRLTVLYRAESKTVIHKDEEGRIKNIRSYTMWHCRCDCGKETDAYGRHLLQQRTKSCGCLRRKKKVEG